MFQDVLHYGFRLYADGLAQELDLIPILFSAPSIVPIAPSGLAGTLTVYPPEHPISQTWTWRTDVLDSWDGDEHRLSLMGAPRESYQMDILIEDAELRRIRADLFNTTGPGVHLIPRWEEGLTVTATPVSTVLNVPNTALSDWMAVNQRVVVVGPTGDAYQALIVSFTSTTITIDVSVPAGSYLGGATHVYPLAAVYFEAGPQVSRWRVNLGRWRMDARVAEFGYAFGTGATALTTFDGVTVLTEQPLGNDTTDEAMEHQEEFFDFGATFTRKHAQLLGDIQRTHAFRIGDAATRQYWKSFLTSVNGRQGTFLLSTWHPDLVLDSQPIDDGFIVIDSSQVSYITKWYPSLAHKRLQFRMASGAVLYREVIDVTDNLDGTESLELDASVDTGALGNVDFISFLETCRLGSDDVEFTWDITEGHVTLPIVVVQA